MPFGSLVYFRPYLTDLKEQHRFSPPTMPGLMLGWKLQPGCTFKGDYKVASLAQVRRLVNKGLGQGRCKVYQVKECWPAKQLTFPLKADFDRQELEGLLDCSPTPGEMCHDEGGGEDLSLEEPARAPKSKSPKLQCSTRVRQMSHFCCPRHVK